MHSTSCQILQFTMGNSDMGTKPKVTKPKRSRSFDQITKLKPKPKLGLFESTKLKPKPKLSVIAKKFWTCEITKPKLKPKPLPSHEAEAKAEALSF